MENGPSPFQTQSVLRSLLDSAGTQPRKRLGQCFLIDRHLMGKLIETANLGPTDCVLEVGCGTGSLTGCLAEKAGHVVAVDVDPVLAKIAREHLMGYSNIEIITADVLKKKSIIDSQVVDAVSASHQRAGGPLKLVANLPYDIAASLIVNLLLGDLAFEKMIFTVQTEVADRLLAKPDTSDYGSLSVICQLLARGRRITRLGPQAFWPSPKVSSTMVGFDVKEREDVPVSDPAGFADFVKAFFRHRRKTMSRIAKMLKLEQQIIPAMEKIGRLPSARPGNLSVEQWVSLYLSSG